MLDVESLGVAFNPLGFGVKEEPLGRDGGQHVQCVTERLPDATQSVQGMNSGQHVRGVRALPAALTQKLMGAESFEQLLEQE